MISGMETLAEYFVRTKNSKQRSLRRLGHRSSQASASSASSTAASTTTTAYLPRTLSIREPLSSTA